jgi:hypothetical protein
MGLGFIKCVLDNCLNVLLFSDVSKIVIALYVDDVLIVSDNLDMIRDLKNEFKQHFQMKDFWLRFQTDRGVSLRHPKNFDTCSYTLNKSADIAVFRGAK